MSDKHLRFSPATLFVFVLAGMMIKPVVAFVPPLTSVTARYTSNGYRVEYSVTDPETGLTVTGTGPYTGQETSSLNVRDGVVAWIQGDKAYYSLYDPVRKYWVEGHQTNNNGPIQIFTNNDGVVAWAHESGLVYYVTYDPLMEPGFWRLGNLTGTRTLDPAQFLNQDGIVAFVYSDGSWIDYNIYNATSNPAGGYWHTGRWSSTNIRDVVISNGTLTWVDGSFQAVTRTRAYDIFNSSGPVWLQFGATKPFASYYANPTSGEAPLWVWFWDLSLGASSKSWTFGDGSSSSLGSQGHEYTQSGLFEVTFSVSGPGGNHETTGQIDFEGPATASPSATPQSTATQTQPPAASPTQTQPAATVTRTETPLPTVTDLSTATPSATDPKDTATPTASTVATSSPTRTPVDEYNQQSLVEWISAFESGEITLNEFLDLVLNWRNDLSPATPTKQHTATLPPTRTTTATNLPTAEPTPTGDMAIFEEGDAWVDFSTYPDGAEVNGVKDGFSPGTYLVDQFASVGVRFRSTKFGSQTLNGIGVGVINGPSNNQIHGMRYAPPMGLDGRTVFEVIFDDPVTRAGVLRRGYINYSGASAVTNFYANDGALLHSRTTPENLTFVSYQTSGGESGIKRIEITSTAPYPDYGAGGIDDLIFSQVGDLSIPDGWQYHP